MNLSKVRNFENQALVILGMLQRASGFMLIVCLMAIAQSVSIAIFFANIFSMKVTAQLTSILPAEDTWVIHALSTGFGLIAGLVIETGSFFFAVNGMKKSSYFSASVSGILSIASYHTIFYGSEINVLLGFGIFTLGFYPSVFIMIASHQLAEKFSNDAQSFMSIHQEANNDKQRLENTSTTSFSPQAASDFEVVKQSLIS